MKDLKKIGQYIYSEWLMKEYPDEIHCEEDLLELVEKRKYLNEFTEWIKENI